MILRNISKIFLKGKKRNEKHQLHKYIGIGKLQTILMTLKNYLKKDLENISKKARKEIKNNTIIKFT